MDTETPTHSAGKTAVVMGSTGLVGGFVLTKLLADSRYSRVIAPTRRPLAVDGGSKLVNPVGDDVVTALENENISGALDHLFVCVGTTKAKTPDPEQYRAIDFGIPTRSSDYVASHGGSYVGIVSSLGASKSSSFPYMRLKGEMEEAVLQCPVPNISILQPSIIMGQRNERRIGETIGKGLSRLFHYVTPRHYRGIHAEKIADRLIENAFQDTGKVTIKSGDIPVAK